MINILVQQRNAAYDDVVNIAAQTNEILAAKDARIKELEAKVVELESSSNAGVS